MFHEHNRLFEEYLTPKTEHNWKQKHRKVADAGAESPLKRLYATPKKRAEKTKTKSRIDTALQTAVQIVANTPFKSLQTSMPHKIDLLDLGCAIIRSAKGTKSNNIPDPNPMSIKDGLMFCQ